MKFECLYSQVAAQIVHCIENAVGDSIREDIRKNNLRTTNSVPSRIWDLLNTALLDSLDATDCCVSTAHRGPWQMVIIFEKTSGSVITLMREKRFAELKRAQQRRLRMHYVDMLPKMFNRELLSDCGQQSFLPKEFSDENDLAILVQRLLSDLVSDISIVRNHVLVLFDTNGFQLTSVRAVMITPNLEIASGCEADWSKYISSNESVIVEQVNEPLAPANDPHHGLKFKAKATARQQRHVRLLKEDNAAKSENN